jgi:cholesterol transport system auxiliary component
VTVGRASVGAALAGAALSLSLVSGCALLAAPPAEPGKAMLNKMPAQVPQRAAGAAVLLVLPPQTTPPYDTTLMAYTVKPYEVAYFSQHEWAATPTDMLQPLIVRTLEHTGSFKAVVVPAYTGPYSYALRTEVQELIADFSAAPAALQLTLRLQLTEGATGRVVAVKDIRIREPLQDQTPNTRIVAANEAVAKVLLELATFVLERTN